MRHIAGNFIGKTIMRTSRWRGGGGSALPGLVVEKIAPGYLGKYAKKIPEGCIIVTGTNGKTTTAKMLRTILEASGKQVIANRAGSNMSRGIISALLEHSSFKGGLNGSVGLFEVDEAFVASVAKQVRPRAIVVLNLLRDQLDRYGELDRTAQLIADGLKYAEHVVLNADDSLVAKLASQAGSAQVHFFGGSSALRKQLPDDASLLAMPARKTEPKSQIQLSLQWSKPNNSGQTMGIKVGARTYQAQLPLPGVFNAYNAAAALTVAYALGMELELAVESLASLKPAFGRSEQLEVSGKQLQLLLVKNPSGFNQILSTFFKSSTKQHILVAINDNFADGRDVSWLWDVDVEQISQQNHQILTSGTRGLDMSLRLKYADIKATNQTSLNKALDQFVSGLPKSQVGYVVPTYTALLALRKQLAKKTKLDEVWE